MQPICKILTYTALSLVLAGPIVAVAQEEPSTPPATTATAPLLDGISLHGTVIETMNSNGFTYIRLDTTQDKIWVAIPETLIKTGQTVTCEPGRTMKNFLSKTLNRTFDAVVFSPGLAQDSSSPGGTSQPVTATAKEDTGFEEALQAENKSSGNMKPMSTLAAGSMAMGMSTGSLGAIVPSGDVNVNKALGPNSYSVGECFEKAKDLNSKTVRVRGKIMKVSRMIMGKNWLHIQDGTGNPLKNEHDLVVTTPEDPEKDTIVTVEGKLSADRDFGAGYKYKVIIEDAKVEK